MGFFSNLFSKMKEEEERKKQFEIEDAVSDFEDKYLERIQNFQDKITELIDSKIDVRKNEGKNPEDILALFDSVVVNYAESKIYPFFESKSNVTYYYIEAYNKLIRNYIEDEKQNFIATRLDYYKDIYEKKTKR